MIDFIGLVYNLYHDIEIFYFIYFFILEKLLIAFLCIARVSDQFMLKTLLCHYILAKVLLVDVYITKPAITLKHEVKRHSSDHLEVGTGNNLKVSSR